jgi:spermidine synthase
MTEKTSLTRLCRGMFLLSMATLMYELILTRIFSVLMWYHFASMAISLALFGLGAAALVVTLLPQRFPDERLEPLAARFALLFSLSTAAFFGLFVLFRLQPQLAFKVLSFFHQPFYQPFQQGFYDRAIPGELLLGLAGLYLLTALPFFFSGLAVSLLLSRRLDDINRLYFWDLLGAGAGCLLIIAVLKLAGGITGILAIAIVGLLAAIAFAPGRGRRLTGGLLLALLVAAAGNLIWGYADLRFARGRYEPNLLWSAWNSYSRVAAYPSQSQEMEHAWGLSRTYRGPVPEQIGMVVDDTGYTTLYRWDGEKTLEFFRSNLIALPYALKPAADTLVIGPGGGRDVLAALAMGASRITAVELNGLIVRGVDEVFGGFTGELYRHPKVRLEIDEGRSFIRRSRQHYDIIQASAVFGRMAPAAGAFTLSENNLYTVEAFQDYWDHLTPDGILTISRFIFERETLRLVSLGLELLKREGVADPAAHLAVIKERGLANFMLKRTPFATAELKLLRRESRDKEFEIVFLPDRRQGDDPFARLIAAGGSAEFYRTFPFDIGPTSDDRPFFYYMYTPADFLRLLTFPEKSNFEDRAVLIIRNLLVVVAALVALFILLPLAIKRRGELRQPGSGRRILYFACLGLGFMLLEIGLLRRFILFLGPPIYALAVILFSLLVFSGLGSLLSGRIAEKRRRRMLIYILLALVLLSNLYVFALPKVLAGWIAAPLLGRVLLAVLLLIPLGLLLGMPLPLGMRLLHQDRAAVAWSWGINSAASVLGAILATVMAMNYGFTLTLLAGEMVYLTALLCILFSQKAKT